MRSTPALALRPGKPRRTATVKLTMVREKVAGGAYHTELLALRAVTIICIWMVSLAGTYKAAAPYLKIGRVIRYGAAAL